MTVRLSVYLDQLPTYPWFEPTANFFARYVMAPGNTHTSSSQLLDY